MAKASERTDEVESAPVATWTGGSALASRVAGGLLVVALACGPIALGERLLFPPAATGAPQSGMSTMEQAADMVERGIAGETGLEVVQAYLSASRDDHAWIDSLMKGAGASASSYPDEAVDYSDPQILLVTAEGQAWSVTVSARVRTAGSDGRTQVMRRAWSVPVMIQTDEKGARSSLVLGWPRPVAVASSTRAALASSGSLLNATSVIGSDAQAMLSAYLTGGDLTRFLSPGTWIEPLEPGLYSGSVRLTKIQASEWKDEWDSRPPEGKTIRLEVDAAISPERPQSGTETAPSGAHQSSWALIMTARAGRWEVSSMEAPSVSNVGTGPATSPHQSQSEGKLQ